jgi:PKD repeat protein
VRALVSVLVSVLLLGVGTTPAVAAAEPGRSAPQPGHVVSEEPSSATPNILDGTVTSLTQVGDQIVVGGTFTQVQNPNTSAIIDRIGVFAFDKDTGRVSTTFDLHLNGDVHKVQAAGDGTSVYVGGSFSSVRGQASPHLLEADVATGALDPDFQPPSLNGQVRDLEVVDGRLWVAGKFTHIGEHAQRALGTLDARTGQRDPYFGGILSGLHNPGRAGSVTDVLQISSNPAHTALVAVGNFTSVDGQGRSQIARFDLGHDAATLSPWRTTLYTQACSSSFDTYMTDVEYSPGGDYFVVSTTGAYGGSGSNSGTSGCDVVARWEDSQDPAARPTWTAYTGGDTTWTVEVTQDVVYAGGHQRWQNNPGAGDRPGPGAVARTGIAALDPVNGLPYSWNPTRARGVGVKDMLATEDGLYVGSDTTLIGPTSGNKYHARIALLPLSSGEALPQVRAFTLPAQVATVGVGGSQLVRRTFDGHAVSAVTGPAGAANRPDWASSVGAFEVNGVLYVGHRNGTLTRQTFDADSYGPAAVVAVSDALTRQATWHDTDLPTMTSLFYAAGRLYFTLNGQDRLYSRAFEIEDDVVGQQRFSVTAPLGVDYATMRGAFIAGGAFYYSDALGRLFRTGWDEAGTATGPQGAPVQVSGPGSDSQNWASRVMFVQRAPPPPPNEPPTAAMQVACTALTCQFDGTDSSDPDGSLAAYDWDFGDGTDHESDPAPTHTYVAAGARTVTLTVTDDRGASARATKVVSTRESTSPIDFVAAANTQGNRTRHVVTVPDGAREGDRLLLFFAANSMSSSYTGPAGWEELQSVDGTGVVGRVYTKVAAASDPGVAVAVTSSGYAKDDVTLAVYRGDAPGAPVSAALLQNTATAEHRTPLVEAADDQHWVVSYWAEKSSTATSWELPAGQTQRATSGDVPSSGHMLALLADSGGVVPRGTHGDLAATANAAGRGMTTTILLAAGDPSTPPANQSPVARAASPSCAGLTCSFDASTSSDPDGDDLSFDWDFGDGSDHGTGARASRTYASPGSRDVTVTVTDSHGAHDTATVTAEPVVAPATAAVSAVATDATVGNRTRHAVTVPSAVQAGDRLVLLFTANSTTKTYVGPDGWTPLFSDDGRNIALRGWTRVATQDDSDSSVAVTSTGYAKSTITVAAYRSEAGTPTITHAEPGIEDGPGAEHVTPSTTVSGSTSWVLSYWSDKSSGTTGWSLPAGVVQRTACAGSGSGHVASVLADSAGPVPPGPAGGLTAMADSTSARGADATLVVAAP